MALGGTLMFAFASVWPGAAGELLRALPLYSDADAREAARRIHQDGLFAFVAQPASGIPFRLFAAEAGRAGESAWSIPVFITARAVRMALVGLAAILGGRAFRDVIDRHFVAVVGLYVVLAATGWAAVTIV
jgi:hypothetical protein